MAIDDSNHSPMRETDDPIRDAQPPELNAGGPEPEAS